MPLVTEDLKHLNEHKSDKVKYNTKYQLQTTSYHSRRLMCFYWIQIAFRL